jgi:outer membrane protein OmpA-like peptidoglycan-associated protein
MTKRRQAADSKCSQNNYYNQYDPNRFIHAAVRRSRSAGPLLPGIALLFLGCAASPEKQASTPTSRGNINLADIHAGRASASKSKFVLVSLPDRLYEVPLRSTSTIAIAPSAVASSTGSATPAVEPGSNAVAAPPALANASTLASAAVPAPLVVAQADGAPAGSPVIEPLRITADKTAQPLPPFAAQDSPTALPVTMTVAVGPAVQSSAPAPIVSREKQSMVPLPGAAVLAVIATPKLKFDTDYESIKHTVKFAFDRSGLGPLAQALMAKILPDAKVATQIKLTGYSDGIGSRLANERVAVARATSIRNELLKYDIEPGKISVEPAVIMGRANASRPTQVQASWQHAQYRRVDVDITRPKPAKMVSLNDAVMQPK